MVKIISNKWKVKIYLAVLFSALLGILFLINISALSSTTETEFSMSFSNPYCADDGSGWWIGDIFIPYTFEGYVCYNESVVEYGSTECCPQTASICDRGTGKCIAGPEHCSGYLTNESCKNFNSAVAVADLREILKPKYCGYNEQYGGLCREKIDNCGCVWNGTYCLTYSEQKICKGNNCYSYSNLPSNISIICDTQSSPRVGQCIFDIRELNDCNTTGRILVSWTANWTGSIQAPDYCQDGSRDIECLSEILLTFFSLASLVIAIIIIIIFYIITARKKRKFKKK